MSGLNLQYVSGTKIREGFFIDQGNGVFTAIWKKEKNIDQILDFQIVDDYLYRQTERSIGDQIHDDLTAKLWVPK